MMRSLAHSRPWASPWRRGALGSALLCSCLLLALSACGVSGTGGSSGGTPTPSTGTATPTTSPATPTAGHFTVTSVDLSVNPTSIAGKACGSSASFTYTAVIHLAGNTNGGTIQLAYTLNNGRSQTPATVTASAGQTSTTYQFTSSGTLPEDHTYPGPAIVMVTSPNQVTSPSALPSGTCTASAGFQVTSVDMAVNPTSIAGKSCGTPLTVTYTATFHLPANGPGGTIQFQYTVNNGRGSTPASLAVAPGQASATYSFQWAGALPADHTYPEPGGVIVQSPNSLNSPLVGPSGTCS